MTLYGTTDLDCLSNHLIPITADSDLIDIMTIKIPINVRIQIQSIDLHISPLTSIQIPGVLIHKLTNKYIDNSYQYYFLKDLLMLSHNSFLIRHDIYDSGLPISKDLKISFRLNSNTNFNYKLTIAFKSYNVSVQSHSCFQHMHQYLPLNLVSTSAIFSSPTLVHCKGFFIETEPIKSMTLFFKPAPGSILPPIPIRPELVLLHAETRWSEQHSHTLREALEQYLPLEVIQLIDTWYQRLTPVVQLYWSPLNRVEYNSMYDSHYVIKPNESLEISTDTTKIFNIYAVLNHKLEYD
jgi:hypothetical protein